MVTVSSGVIVNFTKSIAKHVGISTWENGNIRRTSPVLEGFVETKWGQGPQQQVDDRHSNAEPLTAN